MIRAAALALARDILNQPDRHPAHRRYWAWCTLKFARGQPVNHRQLKVAP